MSAAAKYNDLRLEKDKTYFKIRILNQKLDDLNLLEIPQGRSGLLTPPGTMEMVMILT